MSRWIGMALVVLAAEGRPCSATVIAIGDEERCTFTRQVEAGKDGAFAIVLPEGDYWVHAESEGQISPPSPAGIREGWGDDDLELTLGPTGRVWGFVEDPDGRRLSGARILLRSGPDDLNRGIQWSLDRLPDAEPVALMVTDASGRYEAVCPIGEVFVQADADEFASATASVEIAEAQSAQADLRLSRGFMPQGRVTDTQGLGLAGVHLIISYGEQSDPPIYVGRRDVETDGEGDYAVPDVRVLTFSGYAILEGYLAKDGRPDPKYPARVDIMLVRAGVMEGVVRMRGGGPPPAGTMLGLRWARGGRGRFNKYSDDGNDGKPRMATDGAFRIDGLPPERYVVQACVDGTAFGESGEFGVAEGETVRGIVVELGGSCAIRVRVRDARNGAPVPRAMVGEVFRDGGRVTGGGQSASDEQGRFELKNLLPGRHHIHVSAGSLASKEVEVELREGEVLEQDILLDEGTVLHGSVRFDGTVPDKHVYAQAFAPGTMEQRYVKFDKETGAFEIAALRSGPWYISVALGIEDPKTQFAALRMVDVGKEPVSTIDFDFRSTPRLSGIVRQDGKPYASRAVILLAGGALDGWGWVARMDEEGKFEVHGVPAGDYVVVDASWPQTAPDPDTGLQRIAHGQNDPVVRVPDGDLDGVLIELPPRR